MLNTPLAILLATVFVLYPGAIAAGNLEKPIQITRKLSIHEPTSRILNYMIECGRRYKVSPEVLLAVAKIEGQDLKDGLIRVGPIGRGTYYGPMGIHRCFGKPPYNWDIDDYRVNIECAARVLRGDLRKRLRKYNKSFNGSYLRAILSMIQKYKDEKVFERSNNGQMFKFTNIEVAQNFLKGY